MFLALRYNCVLLKKDMHHLKNIWFFYHLPKFENELTQTYLSFNYQFFNYCVMSTWLLLCRDVSLPLHTFLNLEVEYSKVSLKHFFLLIITYILSMIFQVVTLLKRRWHQHRAMFRGKHARTQSSTNSSTTYTFIDFVSNQPCLDKTSRC